MAATARSAHSAKSARKGGSPLISILAGLFMLFFFVVGTGLHIWTSEAFFLPAGSVSFFPNASIFLQLWHLARGEYGMQMTQAVIWGWVIETIVLGCIAGYEVAHTSIKHRHPGLAWVAIGGMLLAIGFDGWTDYRFTSAVDGTLGAIAWSLAICFVVFFFGIFGFGYILHGIKELRA
jgi:hypothetical protein